MLSLVSPILSVQVLSWPQAPVVVCYVEGHLSLVILQGFELQKSVSSSRTTLGDSHTHIESPLCIPKEVLLYRSVGLSVTIFVPEIPNRGIITDEHWQKPLTMAVSS